MNLVRFARQFRSAVVTLTLRELIREISDKLARFPGDAELDLAFPFAEHLLELENALRANKGGLVATKISEGPQRTKRRI